MISVYQCIYLSNLSMRFASFLSLNNAFLSIEPATLHLIILQLATHQAPGLRVLSAMELGTRKNSPKERPENIRKSGHHLEIIWKTC